MGGLSSKEKKTKAAKTTRKASPSRRDKAPYIPTAPQKVVAASAGAAVERDPSTGISDPEFEERILRFFRFYNPEKINNVSRIIKAWKGTQEGLMEAMVKRYGPEPGIDDTLALPHAETVAKFEAQMGAGAAATVDAEATGSVCNSQHLVRDALKMPVEIAETTSCAGGMVEEEIVSHIPKGGSETQSPLPKTLLDEVVTPPAIEAPEEPGDAAHEPEGEEKGHSFRRRLSAFLGVRAPQKLHTLEECILRYGADEEGIFHFLRETYGEDPSEEEAQAYFVKRLEKIYMCYNPMKVMFAKNELAEHYGNEEEYLQAVSISLGADPMMMEPSQGADSRLFEYNGLTVLDATEEESASIPQDKPHFLQFDESLLREESMKMLCGDERDDVGSAKCDECKAGTVIVDTRVSSPVSPSHAATSMLVSKPTTSEKIPEETERLRHAVEEQQLKLQELHTELESLRRKLTTRSESRPYEARQSIDTIGRAFRTSLNFIEIPSKTPRKSESFVDSFIKVVKSTPSGWHQKIRNSISDMLPPPPFFRPPHDARTTPRCISSINPACFVVNSSSPPQRIRTLAEMRVEYERQREAIRSEERNIGMSQALR